MSECSALATSIGRSCPIHPSVIQPGQFRCDLARSEAAEAAIQRVRAARDLMEESGFDESFWYVAKIDDALDGGESDE